MLSDRRHVLSVTVYCGQTVGWIKMKLGMEVGISPGHIVLFGDPAPPPKKGAQLPQFFAHVYYGQTTVCIRIPFGTDVGLSLGTTPPIFGPCLLWPNGWMDQDASWYGSRTRPRHIVLDGDPAPPARKGHSTPSFRPMSIVATVAHLR